MADETSWMGKRSAEEKERPSLHVAMAKEEITQEETQRVLRELLK